MIESETNQRRVEPTCDIVEKNVKDNIPKLKPFAAPGTTNKPVQQASSNRSASSITPSLSAISIPPVIVESPPDLLGLGITTSYSIKYSFDMNVILLDEPSLPLPTVSTNNMVNSTKPPSIEVIDPLHEVFAAASTINRNENNPTMTDLDKDLSHAFSSSNDNNISTNTSNVMSNDRIMALFNTPQTTTPTASGMNIRPGLIQTPNSITLTIIK